MTTKRLVAIVRWSIPGVFGNKDRLAAGDLCGHPFIGLNSRGPLGQMLSAYLEPVRKDLDIVTWSETYHVAKALVGCGAGVTIADEVTARSGDTSGIRLLPLEPELEFDIRVLSLAATPLSIAAQNFVEHLARSVEAFCAPAIQS